MSVPITQHFTRRDLLCGKSYLVSKSVVQTLIFSDLGPGGGGLARTPEAGTLFSSSFVKHLFGFTYDGWGRDRVKHEQAHLEYLFLPVDSFGPFFGVRVGCQKAEVVGHVEL